VLRLSGSVQKHAPDTPKKGQKRLAGQTEMLLTIPGKKGKKAATKPSAKPSTRQKRAG